MLDYARRQPGAESVTWVRGDASALAPAGAADLAICTGKAIMHVAPAELPSTLMSLAGALRPGGMLSFETRNPAYREWERWTPEATYGERVTSVGPLREWLEVTEVDDGRVVIDGHNVFPDGEDRVYASVLFFRTIDHPGIEHSTRGQRPPVRRRLDPSTGIEGSLLSTEVGRHYDERSPIEDEFRDGHLHMWYWYDRDDPVPLTEAVLRITRKVTDTLGLRAGEHLLDAGCGPGGTAVFLAKAHDIRISGVTVSRFDVGRATARARHAGVGDRVCFQLGDFMALPYRTDSFDAVLALESLQNATDVDGALRELFRVLRPGGRISLSDFTLESAAEPDRVAAFMAALNLPRIPTLSQWLGHVRAAGLEVEEHIQCGPRVFGRRSSYIVAASRRRAEIVARFGDSVFAEFTRRQRGFFAPRQDQIGYAIVSARKPYRWQRMPEDAARRPDAVQVTAVDSYT